VDVRRWLLWLPLAGFAVLLAVVASGLFHPADHSVRSAMIGKHVPEFLLPPMLPTKPGVATARLRTGRAHLVNIFASWCVPCIAEAPQLLRLKAMGVTIEGIAVRDSPAAMASFLRANGDPYVSIGSDRDSAVQLALGSSGVPESFVVDGQGRIVLQHVGDIRADEVQAIAAAMRDAE
jgi:cytochrome c biogenesis protein CcmG/thiol:disulfide interchange protein DsbE